VSSRVRVHAGTVSAFDAHKGYGTVTGDDGETWFFHCTQIADGSRLIDAGARVEFVVGPGLPGRYEAQAVRRVA